jgi:hypothetical protein
VGWSKRVRIIASAAVDGSDVQDCATLDASVGAAVVIETATTAIDNNDTAGDTNNNL